MSIPGLLAIAAMVISVSACGSSRKPIARPPVDHSGQVGACADPERDGVMSKSPRLDRHDRDLNGDGAPELVVTDRSSCTEHGNCYWNVFTRDAGGKCMRLAGTIAGAALETLDETGDRGYRSVRAWWRLSGGGRLLMEEYRYRRGGYRVVDSLLCRRFDDDRIQCAPPLRKGSRGLP
jgi:hypothetical protein